MVPSFSRPVPGFNSSVGNPSEIFNFLFIDREMSEKAKSFKPRLLTRKDGQHSQFSSVPLIIPNDKEYNSSNNSLTEKKSMYIYNYVYSGIVTSSL